MTRGLKIGIIGGGPGGLFTAYLLQEYANAAIDVTIFEASERLGGKIQTLPFNLSSLTYEAGAAELYDYSQHDEDPLRELVEELGLSITRMEGSASIINDQLISTLEDIHAHFGPAAVDSLKLFDHFATDCQSPREFYLSDNSIVKPVVPEQADFQHVIHSIQQPTVQHYVETLIHSDLATEPAFTNAEYGLQNYLMNNPKYMRLYSIDGGNERLTRALAARIRATVKLNCRVTAIEQAEGQAIQVTSAEGIDTFDRVVIALPTLALPKISYGGAVLAAAMQRHIMHYDHPAHYLRITLLFQRPFWRHVFPDSFCMLDQFGGCCLYDESIRHPGCNEGVLGWLIAGETAITMSEWSDADLFQAALNSLPTMMSHGKELFLEGHVHRWIGAVNAMPGGRTAVSIDRRHQPEPSTHPNLFVVGDYLYDSTLNGVLDSADYVAQWIVSDMNEVSGNFK